MTSSGWQEAIPADARDPEVVGDDAEQEADLVGPEAVAREARPMSGGFALLDPLLRGPALVIEADDSPIRSGQGGNDESHPREKSSEMMLDLGDHPSRPVPGGRLILEASILHQRGVAGSAVGPNEQIFDGPLQDTVGREADRVPHTPPLQRFVQGWQGKGRISSDDDGVSSGLAAIDDGEEHLIPSVSTVDVARPERGGQAVAALVEDEERVIADGLEVMGWSAPEARRDVIEGAAGVVPRRGGHPWRFERSESISGSRSFTSRPSTRAAKCWSGGGSCPRSTCGRT